MMWEMSAALKRYLAGCCVIPGCGRPRHVEHAPLAPFCTTHAHARFPGSLAGNVVRALAQEARTLLHPGS